MTPFCSKNSLIGPCVVFFLYNFSPVFLGLFPGQEKGGGMSSFSVACFFVIIVSKRGDQFRKVAFDGLSQHSNASKQSDTAIEFLVYLEKKYLVTGCGWTEVRLVSASSPWVVAWWAHRHFLATSCRWPPWHDLPRWWWQQWCWWWWWGWDEEMMMMGMYKGDD